MDNASQLQAKILIVDDEPIKQKILTGILSKAGYQVRMVADGETALREVGFFQPDLILLDVKMPGMDGFEVCERLKETPDTRDIPVIFISVLEETADKVRAFRVGGVDYIPKPFQVDEVLARVKTHLALRRTEQELAWRNTRLKREIAERNQAEQALKRAHRNLLNVLNGLDAHVYVADFDTYEILFANDSVLQIFGGDIVGQVCWQVFRDERGPCPHCPNSRLLAEEADSTEIYRWDVFNPIAKKWYANYDRGIEWEDGHQVHLQIAIDITDRKQAEESVKQRNRELVLLNQVIRAATTQYETGPFLQIVADELAQAFDMPYVAITQVSEPAAEHTVRVVAEHRPPGYASLLNKTQRVTADDPFRAAMASGQPLILEYTRQHRAVAAPIAEWLDEVGIASLLAVPIQIDGTVVGLIAMGYMEPHQFAPEVVRLAESVARHVATALNRLQLTGTHRRLMAAVAQSAESIIITSTAGEIIYVNPAFEQVTGYSAAEVMGRNPRFLKSGKQSPEFYAEMWAAITAGNVWTGRFVNKKKNGELFTEDASISPVRDDKGNIVSYVAVKRDITRELKLEEQFYQAQKMEAIGRLTAGIAHDFNNILTAINGFSELMLMRFPPDDPQRKSATAILNSGRRAAELVSQLLAFGRKQMISPKKMRLNTLLRESEAMLRRMVGEHIQLSLNLAPGSGLVKIDPSQFEQIIINLAVNARDAMPKGGELTIETGHAVFDETNIDEDISLEPGDYLRMIVRDTGDGIPDDVIEHIFEPFFTTKEVGQGTGLGLATVYGIVKQNKGDIQVSSRLNQGTTFSIFLPRIDEELVVSDLISPRETMPGGSETILLVEDNDSVRGFAKEVLQGVGYAVLEASDGRAALALAADYPQSIDLLVTDVMMPGMTGDVMAKKLNAARPDTKIIFMSGYADDTIDFHPEIARSVFIQKPLSPIALAQTVRLMLDT